MKIKPDMEKEKKLWKAGQVVVGIDEAGRGAWAGPVVVAAVVLPKDHKQVAGITDSKLISSLKRAYYYDLITDFADDFGVGIIEPKVVDSVGVLEATKMGARMAVEMLKTKPSHALIDALDLKNHLDCTQEAIIKGDQKVYSISCASIIAKVTRDNLMSSLSGEYNRYHFYKHKGYGTKLHREMLEKHGVSDIHRVSYKPVKAILKTK